MERLCGLYHNAWNKYFYAICLLGLFYIYPVVLNNSADIRKLFQDIDALKAVVRSTDSSKSAYKLEQVIKDLHLEQARQKHMLKELVAKELETYGSDKTGRTDFAFEMTGGKIVKLTPGTENFDSVKTLFGLTLCEGMHGPRAMIQPDMSPGNCWALKGSHGGVVLKLLGKVQIDAVSLEHISPNVSPTGEVTSAPREFSLWGKENAGDKGKLLGSFSYLLSGPLVQIFPVLQNSDYYEFVEFRVKSNHGNPEFTCVYRFRVHGVLDKSTVKL